MKKTPLLFAIIATAVICKAAETSFTGYFHYANGNFYKSEYSGQGINSIRAPYRPSPDLGAPLSEYGWNWIGWAWSINIAKGGETLTSGTFGVVTRDYYSAYSRTNYYHYYNSDSATSVTTKKWVQTYKDASASYVTLPALIAQSAYNWVPKGWTATDKNYSSASDILYSSIVAQTVYPTADTSQNIRAVYNRTKIVLFNGNGATGGTVANKTITQWFVAGKGATGTTTLPENGFTRTGYTFNGWNAGSTATNGLMPGTSVTLDGTWTSNTSQTYYATWTANRYTISYYANGGTGEMADANATYNTSVAINENGFTRLAYVFKGWATESDGDVAYTPGQQVKNLTTVNGDTVTLYAVWEPLVVPSAEVSAADGTAFCGDSYTVTLSCPLDGAAIYYTTNGVTPRTSAAFAYTDPIVVYGSVNIVAIAVKDGVRSEYTRVSILQITPDTPIITPADGTEFRSESCEVLISCATDGAEIYYTLDGSTPHKESGIRYTVPFTISDTTTVKAMAVGGPLQSEVVTATIIKRSLSLAEATGAIELPFETDDDVPWYPIVDASSENGFAVQSGSIGMNTSTWMETTVRGSGTFSFKWRVECEKDDSGLATWDRLMVFTNGTEAVRIDGITEWQSVTFVFGDHGEHTIRWEYLKDDYDDDIIAFADSAWVSGVSWTADDPLPALDVAATDGDAAAIIAGLSDVRLSEKVIGTTAYGAFRTWVDNKNLSHAVVRDAPNAWLSYALDAPALMSKELTSDDVHIVSLDVEDGGALGTTRPTSFTLEVAIDGVNIGEGARLAEVLSVEGATELDESAFSTDGLSFTLQRTADGKAKAIVTPVGSPPSFFLRMSVK